MADRDEAATRGSTSNREAALQAVGKLAQIAAPDSLAGIVVVERHGDDPPGISQLRPTENASGPLGGLIEAAANEYADLELVEYGPAAEPADGQLMWINVQEVPLLAALSEDEGDLAELPLFNPTIERLRNVRLVAMRAGDGDSSAAFYQAVAGSSVLARSTRVGVILRRGVIDVPRRGQLLILDRGIDTIVVDEFAFFRKRAAFQRIFGFLDELKAQAAVTFTDVTSGLRIEGRDEMLAAVTGSPAMLGKMASIQRKLDQYPAYKTALQMKNLVTFVREHPECGVDVSGEGSEARLVFRSDAQHRFKILKLLDDDYLRSELTKLEYEANSKSAPIG